MIGVCWIAQSSTVGYHDDSPVAEPSALGNDPEKIRVQRGFTAVDIKKFESLGTVVSKSRDHSVGFGIQAGSISYRTKNAMIVLENLSLKPKEVVFIGNKISTDIIGANKTGMKSILLKWNSRHLEKPSSPIEKPDFTINSYNELLKIVENLK